MTAKSLRPFFSYYGGKWRTAKRYPQPIFDRLIEPFAGSAGYSLRHYKKDVVLVEKYGVLAALWRWLIRVDPERILALPDILPGQSVEELDVEEEAKSLIGFWCNAATTRPSKSMSAWARKYKEGSQMFWGERVRIRVAEQVPFIRHWAVVEGQYDDVEDVEATWFVDPPYQIAGKYYVENGVLYKHLSMWCKSRRGQIMVCENRGADWLPFRDLFTAKATPGKHRKGHSEEVLWLGDR